MINDNLFNKDNETRKYFKTKSHILLIDDLDFKNNLQWINFDLFNKYLEKIILKKEK